MLLYHWRVISLYGTVEMRQTKSTADMSLQVYKPPTFLLRIHRHTRKKRKQAGVLGSDRAE